MRVYIKIIAILKPFSVPRTDFPAIHGNSYYLNINSHSFLSARTKDKRWCCFWSNIADVFVNSITGIRSVSDNERK